MIGNETRKGEILTAMVSRGEHSRKHLPSLHMNVTTSRTDVQDFKTWDMRPGPPDPDPQTLRSKQS